MAENVISFPRRTAFECARRAADRHSRATFQIGARRYAFEFFSSVTELNPVDALIVPILPARRRPVTAAAQQPPKRTSGLRTARRIRFAPQTGRAPSREGGRNL